MVIRRGGGIQRIKPTPGPATHETVEATQPTPVATEAIQPILGPATPKAADATWPIPGPAPKTAAAEITWATSASVEKEVGHIKPQAET